MLLFSLRATLETFSVLHRRALCVWMSIRAGTKCLWLLPKDWADDDASRSVRSRTCSSSGTVQRSNTVGTVARTLEVAAAAALAVTSTSISTRCAAGLVAGNCSCATHDYWSCSSSFWWWWWWWSWWSWWWGRQWRWRQRWLLLRLPVVVLTVAPVLVVPLGHGT